MAQRAYTQVCWPGSVTTHARLDVLNARASEVAADIRKALEAVDAKSNWNEATRKVWSYGKIWLQK